MLEWRELFIPTILCRGENISQSDISNVRISEEGLLAKIQGTATYDLHIHTGLDWILCSCPFAQNHGLACKHMAALFIYCENNWANEIIEFFKNSETSPLGQQAIKYKIKRLEKEHEKEKKKIELAEKERIALEEYQEWLRTEPQRQAEREERAKRAEERRKQRALKEEEKRKRREERERKRLEKLKAEEEKRKRLEEERRLAEEKAKKQREEWEAQRKKEQEEWERLRPIREENERRERERLAIEAEEKRQEKLDKETARKRRFLPKHIKEKLAELDELIRMMEDAERVPIERCPLPYEQRMRRLQETGWYYEDYDELDGTIFVDKYGNEYFVPNGFHPEFHK